VTPSYAQSENDERDTTSATASRDAHGSTASATVNLVINSAPTPSSVPYGSLRGTDFQSKIAAAGANTVALPAGTFASSDFAQGTGDGAYLPSCTGLVGAAIGSTVIEMSANTSTKTSPTTGTNGYSLLRLEATELLLQDFTLQGTPQQNLYNGLRLHGIAGAVLRRLKVVAIPGNNHLPPGETFAINAYRCSNLTWDTVEVDGGGVGASGFATNSYSGDLTGTDCSSHDNTYSAGVALWQHSGGATFTRFSAQHNRTGASLERCTGTFTFTDCTFGGNTAQDFFFGNDQSSAVDLVINDPVFTGGQTKLRIAIHATEQGNPNLLTRSNVKVMVGGVDRTSSLVTWV
jgi:hypothetical protein